MTDMFPIPPAPMRDPQRGAEWQLMPPLRPDEYDALKNNIAQRGVMVAVEYDQHGTIIDGHHRVRACQELGIAEWPRVSRTYDTDEERRLQARRLNLDRHHLNQEQRALIADELRDDPNRSNNAIAAGLGVTDKTGEAVRTQLEATSDIPKLERLLGVDGKLRPAKRPPSVFEA